MVRSPCRGLPGAITCAKTFTFTELTKGSKLSSRRASEGAEDCGKSIHKLLYSTRAEFYSNLATSAGRCEEHFTHFREQNLTFVASIWTQLALFRQHCVYIFYTKLHPIRAKM